MAVTPKYLEPIAGEKLYQQRARAALPLLVRQARSEQPIVYEDLAAELGMSNPRNLDYVLGAAGNSVKRLSRAWKEPIPPIQFLVINKTTKVPGPGIDEFVGGNPPFSDRPLWQRRELVRREHIGIFAYPKWKEVLKALHLLPAAPVIPSDLLNLAGQRGGGGESAEHYALKLLVASNPELVGLPANTAEGRTERRLPSADCIDVSFELPRKWMAVEVKPKLSSEEDIVRGIFQCVKYRSLIEAVDHVEGRTRSRSAVLVLSGALPARLRALANQLRVTVIDQVGSPQG